MLRSLNVYTAPKNKEAIPEIQHNSAPVERLFSLTSLVLTPK